MTSEGDNRTSLSSNVFFDDSNLNNNNDNNNNNNNNEDESFDSNGKEDIECKKECDNRVMKYLLENSNKPRRSKLQSDSICTHISSRSRASRLLQKRELDNASIGNCNSLLEARPDDRQYIMKTQLVKFLSVMYAIVLVVIGAIISVAHIGNPHNEMVNIFSLIVKLIGIGWMGFFHWDIQNYKKWAIEYLRPPNDDKATTRSVSSEYEQISITTAVIFDNYSKPSPGVDFDKPIRISAYRFLHGKESGNFYLKSGMIVFCMGSIIHQGVNLAQQIHFFTNKNNECRNAIIVLVWLIRCLSSFYQLYFSYKYANILINRYKFIARFALMHLVGSSITFWFSTIIEETIEDYVFKVQETYNYSSIPDEVIFRSIVSKQMYCRQNALINTDTMEALPYLYPFSIEYNIILASIFYLIWTNIGRNDDQIQEQSTAINGSIHPSGEQDFKSGLTINVDCHASNLGLFCGLCMLLITLTTMVIFFATIKQEDNGTVGVMIYSVQIGSLTLLSILVMPVAYSRIRQLDIINPKHLKDSSIAMDDLLVLVPLPFFITHYILSIIAEVQETTPNNLFLTFIYFLTIVQVLLQSTLIVDGKRRCSNSRRLRFTKPGRGLITFIIILNLTIWILNTFERKSVDKYHSPHNFYGKFIWMIITHTTLPLILFYRFHCSVCLSDIWKHAYEKEEN